MPRLRSVVATKLKQNQIEEVETLAEVREVNFVCPYILLNIVHGYTFSASDEERQTTTGSSWNPSATVP